MKKIKTKMGLMVLLLIISLSFIACEQETKTTPEEAKQIAKEVLEPKYSADVPEFLLTPDKVETEFLGDLEFFDGMPSESTVRKAYDFLDLSRGVEAFLNGMPAASI